MGLLLVSSSFFLVLLAKDKNKKAEDLGLNKGARPVFLEKPRSPSQKDDKNLQIQVYAFLKLHLEAAEGALWPSGLPKSLRFGFTCALRAWGPRLGGRGWLVCGVVGSLIWLFHPLERIKIRK